LSVAEKIGDVLVGRWQAQEDEIETTFASRG
jgi:hypothetical protein